MNIFFPVLILTVIALAAAAGLVYYLDKDASGLDR